MCQYHAPADVPVHRNAFTAGWQVPLPAYMRTRAPHSHVISWQTTGTGSASHTAGAHYAELFQAGGATGNEPALTTAHAPCTVLPPDDADDKNHCEGTGCGSLYINTIQRGLAMAPADAKGILAVGTFAAGSQARSTLEGARLLVAVVCGLGPREAADQCLSGTWHVL